MKSLEHEQEEPHLSSVKVIPKDVGPEKSSSELSLFHCICPFWSLPCSARLLVLCVDLSLLLLAKSWSLCESLSCTFVHDLCCFLQRGYLQREFAAGQCPASLVCWQL